MNRFNVFITVLVCAGLCVLFGALSRSTEDATGWNPSEMYTSTLSGGSSFTNAAYSGSSNSGVALPMPSASFSSRVGAHAPYTYSASPAAGVSQLPSGGSSAVVGHMTSSAEYHSFGGGGNVAAGSSSMSRRSSSMNASPISYNALSVGSVNLPTAPRSSSANNAGYTPSLAQEANYAIASSNMQGGLFDYALQTAYGTASYEADASNYGGRPSAIRGRQNGGVTDSWLDWLYRFGSRFGEQIGDEENGYTYIFSKDQLLAAYNDYIENYWDPMWGDENKPTFEQWWAWLTGAGDSGYFYKGNTYTALPIGDMWPLVVFVLLYVLYITIRQRIVNKNANKSLF